MKARVTKGLLTAVLVLGLLLPGIPIMAQDSSDTTEPVAAVPELRLDEGCKDSGYACEELMALTEVVAALKQQVLEECIVDGHTTDVCSMVIDSSQPGSGPPVVVTSEFQEKEATPDMAFRSGDLSEASGARPAPAYSLPELEVDGLSTEGQSQNTWHWLYSAGHRPSVSYAYGVGYETTWYAAMMIDLTAGQVTDIAYYCHSWPHWVKGYLLNSSGIAIGETATVYWPGYTQWVETPLLQPVSIGAGTYWIILAVRDLGSVYWPLGYISPYVTNGGWISFDGSTWTTLSALGENFSWALEVYVAGEGVTPPSAETLAADEITKTSARLRGNVNDTGGAEYRVRFWWRVLGGSWDHSGWSSYIDYPATWVLPLTGLTQCTDYEFEIQAQNTAGDGWGGIRSFKTNCEERQPPVASVSAHPRSGVPPLEVTFTLSASADPAGHIAAWVLDVYGDGQADYSGTGHPPSQQKHTYGLEDAGKSYTAIFVVGDDQGETDADFVTINLDEREPPTVSLAADPRSGQAPLQVTFFMSASSPDGHIAEWALLTDDGGSYAGSGSPPSTLVHTYEEADSYTAMLGVTDDGGLQDFDAVTITVEPPTAPQIAGVDPAQPVTETTRQPFSILGSGFVEGAEVTFRCPNDELWTIPRFDNPYIEVTPNKIDVEAGFYVVGTWKVWIVNPDEEQSNVFEFTVVPPIEDRVSGIDVSHWQGSIDWVQVHAAGYEFAFVKGTEGVGWTDVNFLTNMNDGHAAGVLVGAYHFARPDLGNSAVAEAEWFVSVAGGCMTEGYLRPVLDLEVGHEELTWPQLSTWVHDFMNTVRSLTGVEPIIYTGWYKNHLDISVAQYDLWIAHWTYDPKLEPNTGIWDDWAFWQYSDQGTVPGIVGDVDLNLFDGNRQALNDFVVGVDQEPEVTTHPATDVTATSATLHGYLESLGGYAAAHSPPEPAQFFFFDDDSVPVEAVISAEATIGDRHVEYWTRVTDGDIHVKNDFVLIHRDVESSEIIKYEKNWRDVEFGGVERAPFEPPGGEYHWKIKVGFIDSDDCGHFYTFHDLQEYPLICWEVRYSNGRTVMYDLGSHQIGYGIPAPSKGFSLSGYHDPDWPDPWISYRLNADAWFGRWCSYTASLSLPTPSSVSSHVSDPDYRYYYALAHGGSNGFQADSQGSHYYSADAADDMQHRPAMVFAFVGHCEGMTATGPGTFSHAFRNGSAEYTVTVGYTGMAGNPGWQYALAWQDHMFQKMDEGHTMRDSFDLASAQYPLIADAVVFVGDPNLRVPSSYVSFEWWTDPADKKETFAQPMSAAGPFSADLADLASGTTYWYRAKATVGDATVYGDALSFMTDDTGEPDLIVQSLTVEPVTSQLGTELTATIVIKNQGTADVTDSFWTDFYEDRPTAPPPYEEGNGAWLTTFLATGATETFTFKFTPATAGEKQAWAQVDTDQDVSDSPYVEGPVIYYVEGEQLAPEVTTHPATDITASSATLRGNLDSLGDYESVGVSLQWGTGKGGPYPYETEPQTMTSTGPFSADLTGLDPGTTYHFRAKAVADGVSVYGGELDFTTEEAEETGTIQVDSNLTGAGFSLQGPADYSGTTPWSETDAPVGTYTITWDEMTGYETPSQEDKTLEADETIHFYGDYEPIPPLAAWFSADKTEVEVVELVTFTNLTTGGTHPYTRAEWDFGDDTPPLVLEGTHDEVMADVEHAYEAPDIYSVSLTMTDSADTTRTEARHDYITVRDVAATAEATRTIDPQITTDGGTVQVTVQFTSLLKETASFSLKETVPAGWTITRVTDDATSFAVDEWIWIMGDAVEPDETKTVIYDLTVPPGTAPADYPISGIVTTMLTGEVNNPVGGHDEVTVVVEEYSLTIGSTDGGEVTVPGEGDPVGTYEEGTEVDLLAAAAEGYKFVEWTGDVQEIDEPLSATTFITMWGDYEITAVFLHDPPLLVTRTLPQAVTQGEVFEVTVTFTSPADAFNAIGMGDVAPADWTVGVDTAWCTPPANAANPAIPWMTDLAEYLWFGPYDEGVSFTAVYRVQVPADAAFDTYTFPGGTLEYYLGTEGPHVAAISGDSEVEVVAARIAGQTREVNCDILPGVTVTLYLDDDLIAATVSDEDGYYTLPVPGPGEYTVVATKEGFRNREQSIPLDELTTYTVGFVGDHGLTSNAPLMSYVLACINLWQFGEPHCKLTMSTVLEVINTWQFPE